MFSIVRIVELNQLAKYFSKVKKSMFLSYA